MIRPDASAILDRALVLSVCDLEGELVERAGKRLVVGISGASGVQDRIRALATLRELGVETHLGMTRLAG